MNTLCYDLGKSVYYDGSNHGNILDALRGYVKDFEKRGGRLMFRMMDVDWQPLSFDSFDGDCFIDTDGNLVFHTEWDKSFVIDGRKRSFRKLYVYEHGFRIVVDVIDDLEQPWFGSEDQYEVVLQQKGKGSSPFDCHA